MSHKRLLIAIDLNFSYVSGCSVFAHKLAYAMLDRGHDVAMILPSETRRFTKTSERGLTVYGVSSLVMPFDKALRFCLPWVWNRRVAAIVDEFKPDLVHFQNHFGVNKAVLATVAKRKIPSIATNHFVPDNLFAFFPFTRFLSRWFGRLAWHDFARAFRQVQLVTSPSRRAAELIEPLLGKSVRPVSCGIALDRFRPDVDSSFLRARYQIPQKTTFLYLGRVDREKRLDVLVEAAARAAGECDFHLVIAGRGGDSQRLKKLSKQLGSDDSVSFTGFVSDSDLPALYNMADCFVIPSTAELQSIVTMEAMASGLPVIAADSIALPELVRDGINGFLFDPGDVDMLAEKMVDVCRHSTDLSAMGQASLELIKDHDYKHTVDEFERLYSELIK
jgi:glycosyltransferase involved in cell wall biosynthesis